jgi:hypothetical protein
MISVWSNEAARLKEELPLSFLKKAAAKKENKE